VKCAGGIILEDTIAGYDSGFRLGPLSLKISPGTFAVIVGPNASGKTTLLRLLAGILRPLSGSVFVCGVHPWDNAGIDSRVVSYIPATPQADPLATPRELIEVSGGTIDYALEILPEVGDILDTRIYALSSGQRRIACYARALSIDAAVLLVDEPTSYLDVSWQSRILGILRRHTSQGGIVVAAMHELHLVPMIADTVALLADGRIIAVGRPDEILRKDLVERVYNTTLTQAKLRGLNILLPDPGTFRD